MIPESEKAGKLEQELTKTLVTTSSAFFELIKKPVKLFLSFSALDQV